MKNHLLSKAHLRSALISFASFVLPLLAADTLPAFKALVMTILNDGWGWAVIAAFGGVALRSLIKYGFLYFELKVKKIKESP